jgi:LCP family protein required for cell wall assembly
MAVPKINGAYSYVGMGEKGINNLKSHLATLLGFAVDGYALVDLDAFVELVDLVGGVEFDVPMRMEYSDPSQDLYIDLQPGVQRLDGRHAMQLVRFRKGYASQDLQRTQVQQEFLRALAKQCLKVVNLSKVGEMAEIFAENVTTDLSLGNIAYFGQELLKCDFDTMYTCTLPGEGIYVDGLSYYALYLEDTLETVNDYFNPYEADITADHVTILTPEYLRALEAERKAEEEAQEEQEEEPVIDPLAPPGEEPTEPELPPEEDPTVESPWEPDADPDSAP